MAINKPEIPSVELPEDWGGIQTPYTEQQTQEGYPEAVPTVVDGGNLNFEKRGIFQNLKYLRTIVDFIRNIPTGKIITTNTNNQLEYSETLPDQTSQEGKYLSTNGTSAEWKDISMDLVDRRIKVVGSLPKPIEEGVLYFIPVVGGQGDTVAKDYTPLYTSYTDISANTYTPTKDGWIFWRATGSGGQVKVNDVVVGLAGEYTDQPFALFMVSQGDVVTCTAKDMFRFIPYTHY
jgi:hypothetical protein